jgi:hypothetical protein
MKKLVLLSLSILSFAVSISAQQVGIRLGANMNNIRFTGIQSDFNPETSFKTGFAGGITYEHDLGSKFSLQSGVVYIQKGFIYGLEQSTTLGGVKIPLSASIHQNSNFLELPLILNYKLGNEKLGFYVGAGPSIGYALNGSVVAKTSAIINLNVYEVPINYSNDNISRWDLTGNVNGGLKLKAGSGHINFGITYQHSFSSAANINMVDLKLQNSGIITQLGYSYTIN